MLLASELSRAVLLLIQSASVAMQDLRVLNMSLLFDAHLLLTAWLLEIALRV